MKTQRSGFQGDDDQTDDDGNSRRRTERLDLRLLAVWAFRDVSTEIHMCCQASTLPLSFDLSATRPWAARVGRFAFTACPLMLRNICFDSTSFASIVRTA